MIIDLLCEDYSRAKANRRMVRLKQNISGYLFIESLVKSWPKSKPLPEWLYGHIPSVSKTEARELYGFHEVNE